MFAHHFWEAFFNICADHGFDALPGAFQCFSVGVQCLRGSCFEELQGAFQCFSVFARVMVLMRYQAHFSGRSVLFSGRSVVARVMGLKSYKAHFNVFQYLRGSCFEGVLLRTFSVFFSVF